MTGGGGRDGAMAWIWNVSQSLCIEGLVPRVLSLGGTETFQGVGGTSGRP
jgi:hypothetical protein